VAGLVLSGHGGSTPVAISVGIVINSLVWLIFWFLLRAIVGRVRG
jgi:hypothetical protein